MMGHSSVSPHDFITRNFESHGMWFKTNADILRTTRIRARRGRGARVKRIGRGQHIQIDPQNPHILGMLGLARIPGIQ